MIVAFDDLELDLLRVGLRRRGVRVRVERQVFEVLAYLVNHRERVVTKQELMDSVWGGRFVSESAVTSRVKQVRQAVGDDGHTQRLVRTVHGHATGSSVRSACSRDRPRRFGVPAGGVEQVFTAMFIFQFADGLATRTWRNAADLQRLLQLGARIVPPA